MDVERRFKEHIAGGKKGAKYTKAHKPLGVEAVWEADSKSDASMLEYRIKKLSKDEKEELILTCGQELHLLIGEREMIFRKVL